MDRLQAMQVFVTTVEAGSLSGAADRLGLSRPVVTRYLAELEAWAAPGCCTAAPAAWA